MTTETIEQRLRCFVDAPNDADWQDVLRRADRMSATTTKRAWLPEGRRRWGSLLVAAVVVVAVAVAPALAFSRTVREFVGLSSSPAPLIQRWVQATLTGTITRNPNPRPGTMITITWTIGEPGKTLDPGFGGEGLFLRLVSKSGAPTERIPAHGARGRYSATTRVPLGGIRNIQLGIIGYSNGPTGRHKAPGLFPITNNPY